MIRGERAKEWAGKGRSPPDRRHDGKELWPDIAREQPFDRDESQSDEAAAAEALEQPAGQEPWHRGRKRADDAARHEQQGSDHHVAAQGDEGDETPARRPGDDRADFIDSERPADELNAVDLAQHRRHDGHHHRLIGGVQHDAEADEAEAGEIARAPQKDPIDAGAGRFAHGWLLPAGEIR